MTLTQFISTYEAELEEEWHDCWKDHFNWDAFVYFAYQRRLEDDY